MERKRAVELLIQEVEKIPYLKTLPFDNDEFRLWLKNVGNIINTGLEQEDKREFSEASQSLSYIRFEDELKQQDYIDEIIRYEIALKSIIQRYEILGIVEEGDKGGEVEEVGEKRVGELYMERQPKIDAVIKAIEKAKAITPKGQQVKVYLPNVLKHNQLRLEELQNILAILEDDEKILTVMRFPRHLLKLPAGYEYTDMLTGEKSSPSTEYFTVKVRRSFNEWCANYWKLPHQQAGSVKWTKKDAIEHITTLTSPFEELEKPNDKKSIYQKIWKWIDTHRILSILGALAAIATIVGVIYSIIG